MKDGKKTTGGGYSFNTGVAQVEFISQLSNNTVYRYWKYRKNPGEDTFKSFKRMLETFALTVASRADPDDLENDFEHISGDNRVDVLAAVDELPEKPREDGDLEKSRNIYIEIIQLMKNLNLDIPENREVDPDDVV